MTARIPFQDRIVEMRKQFCRDNPGQEPTTLYLTNVDKVDVSELAQHLQPEARKQLQQDGIATTFPKILGMNVVYGAETTHLE
jgi:hypothetical protein